MHGYHDRNEQLLHRHHVRQGVVVAVLLFLAFFGVVYLLHRWEENANPSEPTTPAVTGKTTRRGGALFELKDSVETLLIIGIDKFEDARVNDSDGYRNHQQADFLLLVTVDRAEKQCHLLQINRDTMSKVPVLDITGEVMLERREQLALAHTYGSGNEDSSRNTVQAVSTFLHQTPIDHYVTLTMDAVSILNDAVGGVTVEVLDDFSAVDQTLVKGQTVTLRGSQALTYVRARSGMDDPTNINRMARQRQYMAALQDKLIEKIHGDGAFSLHTLMDLSGYLISDCPVEHLADLADRVAEYGFSEIVTPQGEAKKGEEFMEFYADDEAVQALVLEWFYRPAESDSEQSSG